MKKSLLFGFAAAIALASCTTNDQVLDISEAREVSFGTFVDKSTKATGNQDNLEWAGSTFGVWGYYVPGTSFAAAQHVFNEEGTMTIVTRGAKEGSWLYNTGEGQKPAKWIPNQNYRFYAYAPASLGTGTVSCNVVDDKLTVTGFGIQGITELEEDGAVVCAPEEHIDLMVAHRYDRDNRAGFDNSMIGLTFRHILTNVNLKFNSTSKYDVMLTKVRLKGIKTSATATVTPGTVEPASSMNPVWSGLTNALDFAGKLNTTPLTGVSGGADAPNTVGESYYAMADMLMIPQAFTENTPLVLEFDYTVGGKGENGAKTFHRSVQIEKGNWEDGKRITYVVTINTANGDLNQQYDIVFGATTTTDWTNQDGGTSGVQ